MGQTELAWLLHSWKMEIIARTNKRVRMVEDYSEVQSAVVCANCWGWDTPQSGWYMCLVCGRVFLIGAVMSETGIVNSDNPLEQEVARVA